MAFPKTSTNTLDCQADQRIRATTTLTTSRKPYVMTKEELLDHFATHAMTAQIEKMGITNPFALAQTAYRMAKEMVEHRDRMLQEWKAEEDRQLEYASADLHELNLPIRYYRCLTAEDIHTKKKLCEWTEREIRRIPNFGEKGRKLLKEAMAEHGLKLKGQA